MLRNDSSPLVAVAQPQRDDHVARPGDLDVRLGLVAGVGAQLLVQLGQPGVGGEGDLAAEPAEQVGPPLAQVDDQRGHPGGVEADPEYVDRGSEQRRVGLADEHGDRGRLLRRSLLLDAAASGAMGVLLAAGGVLLEDPLGIPAAVLVPVGGSLLAYAAGLWLLGSRSRPSHPAVRVVVAGNLLWVAASVVAVVAGWWSPTGAGTAFLLLQAAAVAIFAELQVTGLRRARSAAA
jgi:hypothetical protein